MGNKASVWERAYVDFSQKHAAKCPSCSEGELEIVFYRYKKSDFGFAIAKCPKCEATHQYSRLKIPEGFSAKTMGDN